LYLAHDVTCRYREEESPELSLVGAEVAEGLFVKKGVEVDWVSEDVGDSDDEDIVVVGDQPLVRSTEAVVE